ncbi:MAG: OmpA family protein [Bacteroidales bacterium]|nr:OmpA family protein [Bacteroidales bacterium]MBN2820245.1 OmpA family protein [Bacteroidales bacterium]
MKNLIIGGIVFVIWSVFSVWLFIYKLQPALQNEITEQTISEQALILPDSLSVADTVKQPEIEIPANMVVLFAFDDFRFNADLKSEEQAMKFKVWFDENPNAVISVTGHTDYIGTDQYNQVLGLKRAQTMQKYLVSLGINDGNLLTVSKGESMPVADNSNDEGRAKNRRAVIALEK